MTHAGSCSCSTGATCDSLRVTFDFTIDPYVSVGRLHFGMTRGQVADVLPPADRQVEQYGGTIVDYFTDDLLSLSYDENGELEFIEWHASRPATLGGVVIDDSETTAVIDRLGVVGGDSTPTDAGVNFEQVGLALYAPGDRVEGVAAYRRGYYEAP